jgi:peptide/nickel transport system substrate-binding protein
VALGDDEALGTVSLTIQTVPADIDPRSTALAQWLARRFTAAGVDTGVTLKKPDVLFRDTLVNHDFDLYVGRLRPTRDPDALYATFHSRFAGESGWQNPFGVADATVDGLLDRQRRTAGKERTRAVADLLHRMAALQPFTPVGFPVDMRAVRTDRFEGWSGGDLRSPLGYFSLSRSDPDATTLRLATLDAELVDGLNPVAVQLLSGSVVPELLYDPLARRYSGDIRPWLARRWSWASEEDSTRPTAVVELRDATWHDGTRLTADDVAFTYRFLADTSMGRADGRVDSPGHGGRLSLVDGVDVVSDHVVRVQFVSASRSVAKRALTLPVLPEHIWRERTGEANVAGFPLASEATEALVWQNPDPVGSGPLRFERRDPGSELVLARNDDHFLHREQSPTGVDDIDEGLAYDRLVFRVAPAGSTAVLLVDRGDVDGVASALPASLTAEIATDDDAVLRASMSRELYHVGYNARRARLGDRRFRTALSRVVNRDAVAEAIFDDFLTPAVTPLAHTRWEPDGDTAAPPAPLTDEDGQLDVAAAREAFREAGYRYDDDRLVG